MIKGEAGRVKSNEFGTVGVVFGILSIVFSLFQPIFGIIIGIVGLVFSLKQHKTMKNKWSKAGVVLNVIGVVLAIVVFIAAFNFIRSIADNPEILTQLQNAGY